MVFAQSTSRNTLQTISSSASSSSGAYFVKHDKSVVAQVSQAVSSARENAFALFAAVNLSDASVIGPRLATCMILIQTLQWLWFALATTVAYPWTNAYVSWLVAICKVARFDLFITDEDASPVPLPVTIVLLAVIAALWAMAVALCKNLRQLAAREANGTTSSSSRSSIGSSHTLASSATFVEDDSNSEHTVRAYASRSWLLYIFSTVLQLSATVLFMPVTALLAGTLRCSAQETNCHSGMHVAGIVIGLMSLVLWLPLCFCFVAFKFPRSIHIESMSEEAATLGISAATGNKMDSSYNAFAVKPSNSSAVDYTATAHNRVALFYQLSCALLAGTYAIVVSTSTVTQWALAATLTALATVNLVANVWYMPYLKAGYQAAQIASFTTVVWSGFCLIIALIYSNEEQVVGSVLLLLGAPIVICLGQMVHFRRKMNLIRLSLSAIDNPLLIEVRVRLLQQTVESTGASTDTLGDDDPLSTSATASKSSSTEIAVSREAELQALHREALRLCQILPNAALLGLQMARLSSSQPASRQRVALLLHLAAQREPAIDVRFGLYCLQASLDECLSDDMKELSVHRYMRFRSLSSEATEQVIVAARCQKSFFAELATPEPNMERLIKDGVVGAVASTNCISCI